MEEASSITFSLLVCGKLLEEEEEERGGEVVEAGIKTLEAAGSDC